MVIPTSLHNFFRRDEAHKRIVWSDCSWQNILVEGYLLIYLSWHCDVDGS